MPFFYGDVCWFICETDTAFFCFFYNRLTKMVFRDQLHFSCHFQQVLFTHFKCFYCCNRWFSLCSCSSFIKDNGINLREVFHRFPAFNERSVAGTISIPRDKGYRSRDNKSTRASDDEKC